MCRSATPEEEVPLYRPWYSCVLMILAYPLGLKPGSLPVRKVNQYSIPHTYRVNQVNHAGTSIVPYLESVRLLSTSRAIHKGRPAKIGFFRSDPSTECLV